MGVGAVPTVDLTSATAAHDLDAAFRSLGFAQLVNHGADASVAATLRSACDRFFALDAAHKLNHVHPDPAANRGYRAKGAEALSYSLGQPSPPDLFESFNCGADNRVTDSPLQQPTPWPEVPGFREAAHAWLAEMEQLSARINALVAEVLDLPRLQANATRGPDTMACINYAPGPDGTESVLPGQQRMGAHSDYTSFTILDADPVPGLEIIGRDGNWMNVIPSPESLLINVGDVLAMFTNDTWPSTLHRVVPMAAGSAARRRSVAYFHYPDLSEVVAPLPAFVSVDRPARYAPVSVEAHLRSKLTAPKTHTPSEGASTIAGRLRTDSS